MIRIADILQKALPRYLRRYGTLPAEYFRVINAILACRTERLGARHYECENCHQPQQHFHSCRNRHCPRCQSYAALQWVQARVREMLPVPYFHIVFTIPSELNPFALRNKRSMYSILYRAANDTLRQLALQDKWLGASIGCIAVLHTWGQNLNDHPHLHCIIPAGGMRTKDRQWKHCRHNFFAPVTVLQQVYKGKFMEYFKSAIAEKEIAFHGRLRQWDNTDKCSALIDMLYRKTWVVYVKPSFVSPQAVIKYLGRYTHRVAISEHRIIAFDGNTVTFTYTDYAHDNARKTMTLPDVEFIRRFLMHILPYRFMRIRHFGIFANHGRTERIQRCREMLAVTDIVNREKSPWWETILKHTGKHPLRCPVCKTGILQLVAIVLPRKRWVCMMT
jgi:hypothetical protein